MSSWTGQQMREALLASLTAATRGGMPISTVTVHFEPGETPGLDNWEVRVGDDLTIAPFTIQRYSLGRKPAVFVAAYNVTTYHWNHGTREDPPDAHEVPLVCTDNPWTAAKRAALWLVEREIDMAHSALSVRWGGEEEP